MSTKFVLFTNAATKEPILVNADHVRTAHQVTGHRRVKLLRTVKMLWTWRATFKPFGPS